MSICANIFVLFRENVSPDRVDAIEELISNRTGVPAPKNRRAGADAQFERFLPMYDADLRADVSEDGTLNVLHTERYSKLLGAPSIEGRLYQNSYLTRHWSEHYGEGPAITYALTMLTLLAQPDVEWVWYTSDYYEGLTKAMTGDRVHEMIDEYVRVGDNFGGRPTRFITTENGVINI